MARKEAQRLLGEIARGVDPSEQRNADRKAISFRELCDLYLAEGIAHKKSATIKSDVGRITHHLKPLLGNIKGRRHRPWRHRAPSYRRYQGADGSSGAEERAAPHWKHRSWRVRCRSAMRHVNGDDARLRCAAGNPR
jgi:hypothetical protein